MSENRNQSETEGTSRVEREYAAIAGHPLTEEELALVRRSAEWQFAHLDDAGKALWRAIRRAFHGR